MNEERHALNIDTRQNKNILLCLICSMDIKKCLIISEAKLLVVIMMILNIKYF